MKAKTSRNILLVLLGFLSIGALFGGGALIISPSGRLIGMPMSNLGNSPFRDFLVPGIILFLFLGVIPGILIFALVKKPQCRLAKSLNLFGDMHWTWTFTIYTAFALIIWIQVEMVFLGTVFWLHTFYIFYALVMIFFALLTPVRELYRN